MAVNHENRPLSPLPAEVKKLQQMNDKLFAQMRNCDVFSVDELQESSYQNNALKNKDSPSLLNKHKTVDAHAVEDQHVVQSSSSGVQEEQCSSDRQMCSPTFANPVDYSVSSKTRDSFGHMTCQVSPTMKSGSSCTSFMGSFSSSSSPSPPHTDGGAAALYRPNEQTCWKQKKCGKLFAGSNKKQHAELFAEAEPMLSDYSKQHPAKQRLKSKTETNNNAGSHLNQTLELIGKNVGLKKPTEPAKSTLKRHLSGGATVAGGVRNSSSTASYKYLTWREKDRRRRFREEWKHLWLVVPHGRYEVMCLVCHKVMTQRKLDTIKRHTVRRHVELLGMPETDRQNLFEQLVRQHSLMGSVDNGHTPGLPPVRLGRKQTESCKSPTAIPGSADSKSTMTGFTKTRNVSTPNWLSGDSLVSRPHQPSKDVRPASQHSSPMKHHHGPLEKSFVESRSQYRGAGSHDTMGHFSQFSKHVPFVEPSLGLPDQHPPLDTYSDTYKAPSTLSNLDVFHKPLQIGATQSAENLQPAMTNHFARSFSSDFSPQSSPFFSAPLWPLIRPDMSSQKFCSNSPKGNIMTSTFTQILEHLATTANSTNNIKPENRSKQTEGDSRKSHANLFNCLDDHLKNLGKIPQPRSINEENQFLRISENSSTMNSLATAPRYSKNKNCTVICPESVKAVSQSADISQIRSSFSDQLLIKEGPSSEYLATPCTMAAAAVAAHSLLRLPPPTWPPQLNSATLNQACPPFGTLMNPAMMATWAAIIASATSGGTAPFWPAMEGFQSKPPQLPFANSARSPFANLGAPRPPFSQPCSLRGIDMAASAKYPMWNWGQGLPNVVTRAADGQGKWLNDSRNSFLGKHEREHKVEHKNSYPSNENWPNNHGGSDSYQSKTFHDGLINMHQDNKSYISQASDPPKFMMSPSRLHESVTKEGSLSVNSKGKISPLGEISRSENCSPYNSKSVHPNSFHGNLIEPISHTRGSSPGQRSTSSASKYSLTDENAGLPTGNYPSWMLDKPTVSPSWPSSFRTFNQNASHPAGPADHSTIAYYGELFRQRQKYAFQIDQSPQTLHPNEPEKPDKRSPDPFPQPTNYTCTNNIPSLSQSNPCSAEVSHEEEMGTTDEKRSDKWETSDASVRSGTQSIQSCSSVKQTRLAKDGLVKDREGLVRQDSLFPVCLLTLRAAEPCLATCHPSVIDTRTEVKAAKQSNSVHRNSFDVQILRLGPEQDLRDCLSQVVTSSDACGAFIITCCGSLQEARLRFANLEERTVHGPFEIVSLVGTLAHDGQPHLHISLADSKGKVIGGHLLGHAPVNTTAEVVLGVIASAQSWPKCGILLNNEHYKDTEGSAELSSPKRSRMDEISSRASLAQGRIRLVRKMDANTGYKELTFEGYPGE